jgi:sortase A
MSTNKTVLAGTLLSAGLFVWVLLHATMFTPEQTTVPTTQAAIVSATIATTSMPVRLQIPKLNIDANVQHVGINTKGNIGTPNNFTDTAWYQGGVQPGQVGTAIVDGHVDNGLSLAGVFKHLDTIAMGDDLYVVEKDGTKLHFVVSDIENYPYEAVPMADILAQHTKRQMVLITCEGAWVAGQKTYDHRLAVYATLATGV